MQSLRIAILVFDGFSEIDAFTALGLQNRLGPPGWRAELASPSARPTSMNGVTVEAQQPLAFANDADAVLLPGNLYARAIAENGALLDRLALDPLRQSIGAQCSGTLLLARLGLLGAMPACPRRRRRFITPRRSARRTLASTGCWTWCGRSSRAAAQRRFRWSSGLRRPAPRGGPARS